MRLLLLSIILIIEIVVIIIHKQQKTVNKNITVRQMEEVAKLSMIECVVNKVITIKKMKSSLVCSMRTTIKAGLNLKGFIQENLKINKDSVDILLPHAERTMTQVNGFKIEYIKKGVIVKRIRANTLHNALIDAQNEIESEDFLNQSGILADAENIATSFR